MTRLACFFVTTRRIRLPSEMMLPTAVQAASRSSWVFLRSMMWMPFRSMKMNGFILGFHRRGGGPGGGAASLGAGSFQRGMLHVLLYVSWFFYSRHLPPESWRTGARTLPPESESMSDENQRFENWNLLRAFFCPYFLRSTMRGSRVNRLSSLSLARRSEFTSTRAREMPSFTAPAWPVRPPPRTFTTTSYLPAVSVTAKGRRISLRSVSTGEQ